MLVSRGLLVTLVLGIVALALSGCGESGPTLYPASGTVTYNGKPVEGASVTFTPESGPIGVGTTDAAGKYTIATLGKPGAVPGENKVSVSKASTVGAGKQMTPEDMMKLQKGGATTKAELPEKYSSPITSGLPPANVTADGAKNVFNFELTD